MPVKGLIYCRKLEYKAPCCEDLLVRGGFRRSGLCLYGFLDRLADRL